uniref:EVA1 domain-containing protein n=1 Tax=Cyprinus carpio TaxID=7962 RepID=A0A8C2DC10_CYPCA
MNVKRKEMDFLSNTIAAYAHIKANPESFGLYFVIGVCFGLVLTLCLLVIRISCKPRTTMAPPMPEKKQLKDYSEEEEEDEESDDEEEDDAVGLDSSIRHSTTEVPMSNPDSQIFWEQEQALLEECTTTNTPEHKLKPFHWLSADW